MVPGVKPALQLQGYKAKAFIVELLSLVWFYVVVFKVLKSIPLPCFYFTTNGSIAIKPACNIGGSTYGIIRRHCSTLVLYYQAIFSFGFLCGKIFQWLISNIYFSCLPPVACFIAACNILMIFPYVPFFLLLCGVQNFCNVACALLLPLLHTTACADLLLYIFSPITVRL